jgi:hypothetical protein
MGEGSLTMFTRQFGLWSILLCGATFLPGCLVIRTSEHIVTIGANGSGEGIIHLVDIRSDEPADSLVRRDFDALMLAYKSPTVKEFEQDGRRIVSRRLRTRGDTLDAEIAYTFSSPTGALVGLRMLPDRFVLTFGADRQIVRTNGSTQKTESGGTQITWDSDVRRMTFEVREKVMPASVSLAALYRAVVR